MLPYLVLVWVFAGALMTRDKSTGTLETLLATPLTLPAIWLGQSLAMFVPAGLLSLAATLVTVLGVNLWTGVLLGEPIAVFPLPAVLGCNVVSPLLYFWLIAVSIRLGFTRSPDLSVLPSFAIGFGLMIGIPAGLGTGAIDLTSWAFLRSYAAATGLLLLSLLPLALLLSRERVVLSGRRE